MTPAPRLGVDIGGTFTDLALEQDGRMRTLKVLTTPRAPEQAVIEGTRAILAQAGLAPGGLGLVIHGTTLATNALIERKGARTAFLTTRGFRDTIELGTESRFEQYDTDMEKPAALVPRRLRLPVPERIAASGEVLLPLDAGAVEALIPTLEAERIESVAIGFLHSFANPRHEQAAAEILRRRLPGLSITLSCEVAPEIREYERFSTACANAYVQPRIAAYLAALQRDLHRDGVSCPLYLMLSGGGITTVETARRFPIRLVESGPAGGAIFARRIAEQCGLARALSYDMGGTTAKICLIDDYRPQSSRVFEVARVYRFRKGSGIPVKIPVIEMVEIGAGGGSIARVDAMGRIAVGPDSAGSEPGPACYGRGGQAATVTDADLALGRIDPEAFSGGRLRLDPAAAAAALARTAGGRFGSRPETFAFGVAEMVDENMAAAARVHAVESGKTLGERTLIAFGGAAPLHAARLAAKLGIGRIVVPTGAGVGSAVGFLWAPVAYEVTRSAYQRLSTFAPGAVNAALGEMQREAHAIVARGAPDRERRETRTAFMRYLGQGHEIAVEMPARDLALADLPALRAAYEAAYDAQYGRLIPGVDIEFLSWSVLVSTAAAGTEAEPPVAPRPAPPPRGRRRVFDPEAGTAIDHALWRREDLAPGMSLAGPAVIAEDETSTVVPPGFAASVGALGYIVLARRETPP